MCNLFHSRFFAVVLAFFPVFVCAQINEQPCLPPKPVKTKPKAYEKVPLKDRVDLAIEQEAYMTKDPALGYVPRERLIAATAYAKSLQQQAEKPALGPITWTERGPSNVSGRTRAVLIDANDASNNTIWVGGVAGGLWKTTNISAANPTWNKINDFFDNLAVSAIAQDPGVPQTMYFGTGEGWFNTDAVRGLGIWKTSNGGTTWTQLSSTNNSTFHYVMKMVVAANGHVFAATRNGGIQRSINGGTSWTKVLGSGVSAATDRAADIEIAANGHLYATMGVLNRDGIYKSTNGGTTWTKLTSGLPTTGYNRIEIACAPSNSNRLYALFHNSNSNNCLGIYTSVDTGSTWTQVGNPSAFGMSNFARGQAWYDLIAAVDPNNDSRVFIGGIDVLVSNNAGTSWTQITQWYGGGGFPYIHADQHGIVFQNGSSSVAYFVNDGGIFRSTNANATNPSFSFKGSNYNVTQFYAADLNPGSGSNEFLAGTQDNGTHRFTAPGINTTTEVTDGDGAFCHIDQNQANIQISSYVYNDYWVTTNSWNSNTTYTVSSSAGRFINPTDYDDASNVLYCCYNAGQYMHVNGIGGTLSNTVKTSAQFGSAQVSAVKVSPNTSNRVFFGLDNGNVVRVDNANASSPNATVIRNVANNWYVSSIEVESGNDNHLLITYSNYGVNSVWETTDGGTTWTSVEGNLPDMPIRWAMFAPNNADQALVATELGVWSTDNLNGASTNWGTSNSGLANVRTDMIKSRSSDKVVIAATHGRGLFSTDYFTSAGNLTVTPMNQTVSIASGSVAYSVNTGVNWTVVDDKPWVTISPTSGTGSGTFTASYTANAGNDSRVANITVSVPGSQITVTLTQNGNCNNFNEPLNETCNTNAPVIIMGDTVRSQIANATDDDYYKFSLSNPAIVRFQLTNLPFDYDLKVLNGACGVIGAAESAGTADEILWGQLPAGTYYAQVYGYNGAFSNTDCYALQIDESPPLSVETNTTDVTCSGDATGAISTVVTGGTEPYSYAWDNGETTSYLDNIPAGEYNLTVTDAIGFSTTTQVVVSEPAPLYMSITYSDVLCFGDQNGEIAVSGFGGTGLYDFHLTGLMIDEIQNDVDNTVFTGLPPDDYLLEATDDAGCSVADLVVVSEPAVLSLATVVINESCTPGADGSIALNASGGTPTYSYDWSDGQTTDVAVGLIAGAYSVTLTDANNCMDSAQDNVILGVDDDLKVHVDLKVILQGPYVSAVQLMQDSLRAKGLIPLSEPYTGLSNFTHVGGGGETTTSSVLSVTGSNAVVDWVFVELRSASDPLTVLLTRAALLQRDGDVVDVDGVSPLILDVSTEEDYYAVVRHRNHFGVQVGSPIYYPTCDTIETDFSTLLPIDIYAYNGINAARRLVSGKYVLWAGNGRIDYLLKYNGSVNDRSAILSVVGISTPNNIVSGYLPTDYNMDGVVKYNGSANDRNVLLGNIGISTPSNVLTDQIAH
jgi:hypothetical protein